MRKVVLHNRWKRVLFSAIKNLRPSDLSYTIFLGVLLFISFTGIATAQEPKDIGTQTVTVVKSFTPTVADADKIKSVPQINDSLELQKKQIAYTIFSVPVASTFTPAKAKAERVKKVPPPVLYNTYAALGLGSFNNAQADFYTSQEIGRDEHLLDVAFNHFSSRGAIEGTPLETNFYDTDLQVGYTVSERDREWGATATLGHQLYHWYGLQPDTFTEAQVTALDEQQNYFAAGAKGHFTMEDSFFKRGELAINRFWDALDSQENRFIGTVQWEAPISTELVDFEVVADYVGGNFANAPLDSIANTEGIDFGHLILSGGPSLTVIREALTVNLGANVTYGMDLERKEGTFSFYPAITASYRLIDDQVIAYGGLEGGLDQNTYQSFVDSNPFVSPTLLIRPTDRQYDGFAGIKGQWTSNIGYNVKGFYRAENNRALFRLNPQNTARMDEGGYYLGNSFQVIYDDLKTFGGFAEITLAVNRDCTLGLNGTYSNYNTVSDNPAWNLPEIEGSLFMDYQITDQWYFGAKLFFVGEREDLQVVAANNVPPEAFVSEAVTLESFFDANAHIGYRFGDQLSAYLKLSNIAGTAYERWSNFRVQGFQALLGVSYQFDL